MSIYFVKGKGWRFDFTPNKTRYTEAWFQSKRAAVLAEAEKRKEVANPKSAEAMPTDMVFLDFLNLRLDHVRAYNSKSHYISYKYMARRWNSKWGELMCKEITRDMVKKHLAERKKVSSYTANQDLRYLRACFNFGISEQRISCDPTKGISFFPVDKKIKYVPPNGDIDRVIDAADPDTQDYLWTIRETMARVSEVNRLTWDDVNLNDRSVILYTRKKRGGDLTPRKIAMTEKLHEVLSSRYEKRDPDKPWVFWHRYWSQKKGKFCEGPYNDRKKNHEIALQKGGSEIFPVSSATALRCIHYGWKQCPSRVDTKDTGAREPKDHRIVSA